MRNIFAETLYQCAVEDERIHIVVADISPAGPMAKFQKEYPGRFINVGVAEQVMIGMAAGLALDGKKPFAYTIATFSLYRPFEMVRNDLGYQNLPVTVVGMGAGVVYSTLGGTHHTMEDVSIASSIPNMQVLSPCDPLEVAAATRHCAIQDSGPIYLRIGKAGEPNITCNALEEFKFGKIRQISNGNDVAVISYGAVAALAKKSIEFASNQGANPSFYCCHTIKPLDYDRLKKILQKYKKIIVVEEQIFNGSLSMNIMAFAHSIGSKAPIVPFTLEDKFIHCYGSHTELLERHGISEKAIISEILSRV